ncbi:LysM peptidoglycan-binding domain-containing protein [Epibacterium ulvae]|uniref:LysM peptidoglycan-binding domain-containing protein n=1 Tax=Epibacterium ulvae TaxID=1156985 RepID=UPI001BFBFA01|nr:LysM peptidoglycan-binding domain-containing protein [Epibacterium ulvae]MBT8155426.1 LysM peptidoglycan-binding domain-containing protein [Epibacterium ulvae]
MAETSGSGGVGALSIAGIATVVVIVGGVVLTQFGVFDGSEDVAETPVVAEQPSAEVPVEPAPTVTPPVAPPEAVPSEPVQVEPETTAVELPVAPAPAPTVETVDNAEAEETETTAVEATPAEPDTELEQTTTEVSPVTPTVTAPEVTAEPAPEVTAEADTVGPDDVADEIATPAAPPAGEPAAEPTAALQAPEIDVIRFDPDGAGLIAGRALAGSRVMILLDGTVIEEVAASGSGEFVAFPVVEPATQPRVVTIAAGAGEEIANSDVSFILAPVTPVAVAEADVTPAPVETPAEPAPVADQPAEVAAPEVAQAEAEPEQVAEAAEAEPATAPQVEPIVADEPQHVAEVEPPVQPVVPVAPEIGNEAVTELAPANVPTQTETTAEEQAGDSPQTLALLQTQNTTETPAAPKPTTQSANQPIAAQEQEAPKPQSAAIAVLRTGPEGVEVVQPVAPSTPELADKVALDAISYTPTGDVLLTGRARPAALVRVYIDNVPVVDVRTNVSGRWRTGLDGVAPGIYTLRLDEIDPLEGKVLSRLETPFKREAPEVLVQPAPEPGAPAVGTTVRAVTVQKGDTLWAISQARYGDGFLFVRVFEANKEAIRNPDLIYPGQIFNLPE